jgi:hypothetical protein
VGRLIELMRQKVLVIANPHFYTKRSLLLLLLQKSFRYILFLRDEKPSKDIIQQTAKLAKSGKGKTALVLGNGPSLDRLIPSQANLYFDDIFVVNGFFDLRISKDLTPSYYCLSDPISLKELSDLDRNGGNRFREYLHQNADCVLLLPHTWISKDLNLPNKTVYFDDRERTFFSHSITPLKPRSYTSVTLYKALAFACYMEYENVYILGFDNTEFYSYVGGLNNKVTNSGMTYATRKNQIKNLNENFDLPLFVSGMAGRMQSYAHLFGDLLSFSENPIINLDSSSLTDAFPKISEHPSIKDYN